MKLNYLLTNYFLPMKKFLYSLATILCFCCFNIVSAQDCVNTDNGASDSYGDTCASWYDANETPGSYGCSGAYDTADFIAADMCCACGGGSNPL